MKIMSAYLSRSARVWTLSYSIFLSQAVGLLAADLVSQEVPDPTSAANPENARRCLVTQVEAVPQSNPIEGLPVSSKSKDDNVAAAPPLGGDPKAGYVLSNGSTTLLVSLSKIEIIDSIAFRNNGAKGNVLIATADAKLPADGPQWHKVIQHDLTPDAVKIKIGPSEAKYVKLTFHVIETGRIAGLGVYSALGGNDLASTNLTMANTSLARAEGQTVPDPKDAKDGKDAKDVVMDVKDFKACCNEPEPPAEGPPPPAEPPGSFVSIPVVSP